MSVTTLFAGVLLAQAAPLALVQPSAESDEVAYVDVGYSQLAHGDNRAAAARILANPALADDPAALINLGTASARLGEFDKAQGYFRAAMVSRNRVNLELADGRWMDSRRVAQAAMNQLAKRSLAVR